MKEELQRMLGRMAELTKEMEELQQQITKFCMQSGLLDTMKSNEEKNNQEEKEPKEEIELISDLETAIHPQVFEFLDLYTMEERMMYLKYKIDWKTITEKDLDLMAVSVDLVLKEGEISDKINDLVHCIEHMAQWEINGKRR